MLAPYPPPGIDRNARCANCGHPAKVHNYWSEGCLVGWGWQGERFVHLPGGCGCPAFREKVR